MFELLNKFIEKMLKKITLIITLVGLFVMLGLLLYSPISVIDRTEDLNKSEINSLVSLTGKITDIYNSEKYSYLTLDNSLKVTLSNSYKVEYQNRRVQIIGKIEDYYGKKQIKVLRIKTID